MALRADKLAALDRLLAQMLALPAAEQAAWVDALQGDDAALAPALRDLLAQPGLLDGDGAGDAWSSPLRAAIADAVGVTPDFHVGQAVGPYRLLRPLGEGGMGVVWLAERADGTLGRQVALKLVRTGLQPWRLDQRFERERDILGSLEHPHIARLYEAGATKQGQAFLAMEYVAGRPITEHADAAGLEVPARLRLFLQVLAAVQHAHQRLVVHRDLKPSNILVDAQGSVRLLDFGIAQLQVQGQVQGQGQSDRQPQASLTELGQALLTPQYASPEQVAHAPVSTASDVYSLGVVLCALLSGHGPYAPSRDSRAALEEAILQGELRRPSQLVPPARRAALRGDLDNVVGKALQRDPAQRYASADALAQDLQRHLAGVPVLAHPDSLAYRARKFVARNRLAVAAGAAVTLALLLGTGLTAWQAGLARQQAARATREARRARAVQQFLVGLFDAADPARAQGREPTVRDLAQRAERDLPRLSGDEETTDAVRGAMVDILVRLGEDKRALALAQAQVQQARQRSGADSLQAGRALLALGHVYAGLSEHESALTALQQAQRILAAHRIDEQPETAIEEEIAHELIELNRTDEGVQLLQAALPGLQARLGATAWTVLGVQAELAAALGVLGRQTEALALAREVEPHLAQADAAHGLDVAFLRANLGHLYWRSGRWADAQRVLQLAIADIDRLQGPDNGNALPMLFTLSAVQRDSGAPVAALASCAELLRRSTSAQGAEAGATRARRAYCVAPLLLTGQVAEALAQARRAATGAPRGLAEQRQLDRTLATATLVHGDATDALRGLAQLAAQEQAAGLTDNGHAATLLLLSAAARLAGDAGRAAAAAEQALAIWRPRDLFDSRINAARALLQLALARLAAGTLDAAAAAEQDAETRLRAALPDGHPTLLAAGLVRAALLRGRGQASPAAALERELRAQLQRGAGIVLAPDLPFLP